MKTDTVRQNLLTAQITLAKSHTAKSNSLGCVYNSLHAAELSGPIPVAARSKAWVYSRSLAGIMGSNPAGGMDFFLLYSVCVVR
jgi:hypothetical protein